MPKRLLFFEKPSRLSVLEPGEVQAYYDIDFGSDGIPAGKNSKTALWPLILMLRSEPRIKPMILSCCGSKNKPSNPDFMVRDFRKQLKKVNKNPLNIDGKIIHFRRRKFKEDLPAIAMFLGIKHPGGFSFRRYCFVVGRYDKKLKDNL